MRRWMWLSAVVVGLLAGCDAVTVEIGSELEQQVSSPDTEAIGTSGYTEFGIIREFAAPQVVFAGEEMVFTDLFLMEMPPRDYLILGDTGEYIARANGSILWLNEGFGEALIQTRATITREDGETYDLVASSGVVSGEATERWAEPVEILLVPDEPGIYRLELVSEVNIFDPTEEARASTIMTEVVVLSRPTEAWTEEARYGNPQYGSLLDDGLLLDWRAYGEGPCRLSTDNAELAILIDEACLSNQTADADGLFEVYLEVLELASEDPQIEADLRDQIGLVFASTGEWQLAARQFQESLRIWIELDNAYRVGAALHNLGVTDLATDRVDEATRNLEQGLQIREHSDDFPGIFLSYGQLGLFWEEPEALYEAGEVLSDLEWEQGPPLLDIAADIDNDHVE